MPRAAIDVVNFLGWGWGWGLKSAIIFQSNPTVRSMMQQLSPRVCKRWFPNGGSSSVWERNSATPLFTSIFYPLITSFLPKFYLNLTSAQPAISNHGLEPTLYIPSVSGKIVLRHSLPRCIEVPLRPLWVLKQA